MISQIAYLLGAGALILIVLFTAVWLVQLKTGNAGIVDPVWALSFPLVAGLYFIMTPPGIRKWWMLGMVVLWGTRLSFHLFTRYIVENKEDVRYTALRKEWGSKQNWLMLRFYYFQAILALVLSLPFALIMLDQSGSAGPFLIAGASLALIAVIGETTADRQLNNFKADPANKGKVCERGLWYYSRHPNYFFEWLIWVSFFVAALGSAYGWVTIVCPALMLYFLLNVTGIPYTEAQSLKSKGAAYEAYQRSTSAFIPLPKRETKTQ